MELDTSLFNTQQYKIRIKGKVKKSRERNSALSTPQCSSYWKESLLVALDFFANNLLLYIGVVVNNNNNNNPDL